MSRTKKGAKGPGFEYWGKRPGSGLSPSKKNKADYTAEERAKAKHQLIKEPQEPEYDPREWTPSIPEEDNA